MASAWPVVSSPSVNVGVALQTGACSSGLLANYLGTYLGKDRLETTWKIPGLPFIVVKKNPMKYKCNLSPVCV